MLALCFLLTAVLLGWWVVKLSFEHTLVGLIDRGLAGRPVPLSPAIILWPASVFVGLMLLTWLVYLQARFFASQYQQPLLLANVCSLAVIAVLSVVVVFWRWRARHLLPGGPGYRKRRPGSKAEVVLGALLVGLAVALMMRTLFLEGTRLHIGVSVMSDFGPHLAVIRSFSFGENFPTEYPHFPAGDIRYHFLFMFLAGNLEALGLPLDWAFNLPSIVAYAGGWMVLYGFAVIVTRSRVAGALTVLFGLLRSSWAWWDFGQSSWATFFQRAWAHDGFLGRTHREADWGLWSQNIYLNQRHLLFGAGIVLIVLCITLPLVRDAALGWRERSTAGIAARLRWYWLSKDAWLPREASHSLPVLMAGAVLGLTSFWNGAMVIGGLVTLAALTAVSRHRLEYLGLALIAGGLGYLQNQMFLKAGELALKPQVVFGFLAEPRTALGVVRYLFNLTGVVPWILALIALTIASPWVARMLRFSPIPGLSGLLFGFSAAAILAFFVQFTPEIAINHKYLMFSLLLLNIPIAAVVASWIGSRVWSLRLMAVALTISMIATGAIELRGCWNRNKPEGAIVMSLDDPLLTWAKAKTAPKEIFLTDWFGVHPLLLAGRSIFLGWPYFGWSAGYDTDYRMKIVRGIYGGTDRAEIQRLVVEHEIDYIMIDPENRKHELYRLNEPLLRSMYPFVFQAGETLVLKTGARTAVKREAISP